MNTKQQFRQQRRQAMHHGPTRCRWLVPVALISMIGVACSSTEAEPISAGAVTGERRTSIDAAADVASWPVADEAKLALRDLSAGERSDDSSAVVEANRVAALRDLSAGERSDDSSAVVEANRVAALRDLSR